MVLVRSLSRVDPLVRLLALAIVLASVLPVSEPARPAAQAIANGAVFFLFLLNGLRLPRADVLRGLANMRFLAPLALWCFGAMAIAGWGLARAFDGWLPPLVALGFCYLGTLPSTVQSATAYTSLARGSVASAVIAAAALNILGVFVTAPLFAVLSGGNAAPFDLSALQKIALVLLLPFAIGQAAHGRFGHIVREHRAVATWMDRIAIAIAVYVAFSAAVSGGLWDRMDLAQWGLLLLGVAAFLAFGFAGAWMTGKALALPREERTAFLFSGGQKSIAMGAPLAALLFPPATAGLVLLPVLVYHLAQLVLSAPLANRLAGGPPPDRPSSRCDEPTTTAKSR